MTLGGSFFKHGQRRINRSRELYEAKTGHMLHCQQPISRTEISDPVTEP